MDFFLAFFFNQHFKVYKHLKESVSFRACWVLMLKFQTRLRFYEPASKRAFNMYAV